MNKRSVKNIVEKNKVKTPEILKESLSTEQKKESGLLNEDNLLDDTI